MLRTDHNSVHRVLPSRPLLMLGLALGFASLAPTGGNIQNGEHHRHYVGRSAALAVLTGLLLVVVAVPASPARTGGLRG